MMIRAKQPLVVAASHQGCMMRGLGFASFSYRCAASTSTSSTGSTLENVLVEQRERVGIITMNRPKVGKKTMTSINRPSLVSGVLLCGA